MRQKAVITKLSQSVTEVYYKVRQVLQNASSITKCDRKLLQSASGTVKPLNSGHLRILNNCLLLGGSLTKIDTVGTKDFVRYSRHGLYSGCPLLGVFTVLQSVTRCYYKVRQVLQSAIVITK